MPETTPPKNRTCDLAARSLQICDRPFEAASLEELRDALAASMAENETTETPRRNILYAHASVLDAVFNRLLVKALTSPYRNDDANNANFVNEEYLNLALRAQKQCRTTIEAIKTSTTKPDKK